MTLLKTNDTNNRFEEISDIIDVTPSWILKSGITTITFIIIIVFCFSIIIRYPETIVAKGELTSNNPPIQIRSKSSGYITDFYIEDGAYMNSNNNIFAIKNLTDTDDLEILLNWMDEFNQISHPKNYLDLELQSNLKLGNMQEEYIALHMNFEELQAVLNDNLVFQKLNIIKEEITKINDITRSKESERNEFQKELLLEMEVHNRNKNLYDNKTISLDEYQKSEIEFLKKKQHLKQIESSITLYKIEKDQKKKEQIDLKEGRYTKLRKVILSNKELISSLKNSITKWNEEFIIKAPSSGFLSMNINLNINSYVKKDDILGHIVSDTNQTTFFILNVPNTNFGTIKPGQNVLLKIDAFPFEEYGIVQAKIAKINNLPNEVKGNKQEYQIVTNEFKNIVTDYGINIPYKPNLKVNAEIITQEYSLLERIFNKLSSSIK